MTVELGVWQRYFQPMVEGKKTFEVRTRFSSITGEERKFSVGDILYCKEQIDDSQEYTGRTASFEVTYILPEEFAGKDVFVLAIKPVEVV